MALDEKTKLVCELIRSLYDERCQVSNYEGDSISKGHYFAFIDTVIKELEHIKNDTVSESCAYKEYLKETKYNEDMLRLKDENRSNLSERIKAVVNNDFVNAFNNTFCFKTDNLKLPYDFEPATLTRKGTIGKEWLRYIIEGLLIEDLLQNGVNERIIKVNDQWVNETNVDRHYVVKDKFFGIFLFDYKMERMFPEAKNFAHTYKFTRLRIKFNSPLAEWITII